MKALLTIFLAALISMNVCSQEQPAWQTQFTSPVNWYKLSKTGILIVCTKDALYGVDQFKKTRWEIPELANMKRENYAESDSLPIAEIKGLPTKTKSVKAMWKDLKTMAKPTFNFLYIDPVTGSVLFDSRTLDNIEITNKNILPLLNAVWLEGMEGETRVMGMADIATGKLKWYKPKPVQLKKLTFRDNFSAFIVDPDRNIVLTYADKTFRYNSNTGDVMWQRDSAINSPIFFGTDKNKFFGKYKGLCEFDLATGNYIRGDTMTYAVANEKYKKSVNENAMDYIPSELLLFTSHNVKVNEANFEITGGAGLGNNSFNYYDLHTLQPLWLKCPSFPAYFIRNVFPVKDAYFVTLRDLNGQNAIALVDKSGEPVWKYPIKVSAKLKFLYTDYGIIYISSSELNIIDVTTGKTRLANSISYSPDEDILYANDAARNTVVLYKNNSLYTIDYKNASVKKIVDKLEFKGDKEEKTPVQLNVLDNGYFIGSSQNVMLVGFDGAVIYRNYYKPSGMPAWLLNGLATVATIGIGYLTYGTGSEKLTNELWKSNFVSTDDYVDASVLNYYSPGLGNGLLLSSALGNSFQRENVRIESAYKMRDTRPVYARLPSGKNGFFFIEKGSGKVIRTLELADKDPDCEIDLISNALFYLPDAKNVYYYNLAAGTN